MDYQPIKNIIITNKKEVGIFIVSALLTIAFFFLTKNKIFTGILLYVGLFFISIICLVLFFVAGLAIFRSLVAASVSLSVVIFLAQSYCELPKEAMKANDSAKFLFVFGLGYSILIFLNSLKKEIFGEKNKNGILPTMKVINDGKHSWLLIFLFSVISGIFFASIYAVTHPIISNLCFL